MLLKLISTSLAVIITAYLLPGVHLDGIFAALVVAIVLSLLNTLLKPILVVLTIPATILSLGLFLLVINAFIIMLADDLVSGFQVDSFWWALIFSIILSIISSLFKEKENKTDNYD